MTPTHFAQASLIDFIEQCQHGVDDRRAARKERAATSVEPAVAARPARTPQVVIRRYRLRHLFHGRQMAS